MKKTLVLLIIAVFLFTAQLPPLTAGAGNLSSFNGTGEAYAETGLSAANALLTPVTADLTTPEAKEYSKPRGTVLATDTVPFKIYDDGTAVRNEDGLTLSHGYLTVQKSNPLEAYDGFVMEIRYCAGETGEAPQANQAFLVMSAKSYGSTPALTDQTTLLSVTESGEVYVKGAKVSGNQKSGFGLTPRYGTVAPGEECLLTVRYIDSSLTVTFTAGNTVTELVRSFACEIEGVRQLTLGADKTTANRLYNVTWKSLSFTEYGTYVPESTEGLKAVVQAGESCTEFRDLEKALSFAKNAAKAGSFALLELYDDWRTQKSVTVEGGTSLTINLNGHIIDRGLRGRMTEDGAVICVKENAALTILDTAPMTAHYSSAITGGVITGGAGDDCGGGIELEKNARLYMTGGSVVNCVTNDHGGAIRVKGDGVKIFVSNAGFYTNMTLDSTDNSHGGAIYVDGDASYAKFTDTVFEGNYSEDNGGAIYMNDGRLVLLSCRFTDNSCLDDGGAIYFESGSNSNMEDTLFLRNRAGGDGGAIFCNSNEQTKICGTFRENRAGDQGGAIHVNGDEVAVVDSSITENKAKTGGGLYVDELHDLNIQGLLTVTGNQNSGGSADNVFLDSLWPAAAHIYSGGLYEGSKVGIRTGSSGQVVCERISEYQKRFFVSDTGSTLKFTADSGQTRTEYLISSVIGKGWVPFILAGFGMILLAGVILFIILRKKRRGGR